MNTHEFYAYINHLMQSKGGCCFASANRYCAEGLRLKREYEESMRSEISN